MYSDCDQGVHCGSVTPDDHYTSTVTTVAMVCSAPLGTSLHRPAGGSLTNGLGASRDVEYSCQSAEECKPTYIHSVWLAMVLQLVTHAQMGNPGAVVMAVLLGILLAVVVAVILHHLLL